ncbi:Zn-ribbon domain-containing OB-fold protein [Streptomyces sp. NPDC087228]|uniref:Zn-ribbon domain-containing OB-fold protein n=1 Tax=Streptomyces sp. NPDC087228 TaxID=3365772 RepID=UPI0038031E52
MTTAAVRFDLPEPDAFTRPYWDAAARGQLLLRRCGACGRAHHYPREFCPHCWSEDVAWERASGDATLYTWSVVHRNDLPPFGARVPYTAAVVDLAEGPRMMTEIVECAESALAIGMRLRVAFRQEAGQEVGRGTDQEMGREVGRGTDQETGREAVPVFRPWSSGPG